jgi:hypothetical protein
MCKHECHRNYMNLMIKEGRRWWTAKTIRAGAFWPWRARPIWASSTHSFFPNSAGCQYRKIGPVNWSNWPVRREPRFDTVSHDKKADRYQNWAWPVRLVTMVTGRFDRFLDICHCNFRISEICHYHSCIWEYVITISSFFEICHFVRIWCPWTHLQTLIFLYGQECPLHLYCWLVDSWVPRVIPFLFPFFPNPSSRSRSSGRLLCQHSPSSCGWRRGR